MRACARFLTPSGEEVDLGPGDLIGRLASADLHLAEPRISEAHAMVSLRAGELVLLALRRRFRVDGSARNALVLEAGLEIELGRGLTLTCVEVVLPDFVLGLRAEGLPSMLLPPVLSLYVGEPLRARPRFAGDAAAVIWSEGARFLLREGQGEAREVRHGDAFDVGGARVSLVGLPLRSAEVANTALQTGEAPRTWMLFHDVVKVMQAEHEMMLLSGHPAQIISELAAIAQPAPWRSVAREIWRDDVDEHRLRRRWDMALGRLRHKLREANLPVDLVRPDGAGNVELRLSPRDLVEDRS